MNFNFKELSVLVNGSSDLLYRVSRYFNDEVGLQIPDGKIVHIQEDDRNIEVDFKFPYNRVEVKECQEYNYYRYNTLVRKIFREGDSFKSISFVKNDEEAILKPFRELYFEKFQAKFL